MSVLGPQSGHLAAEPHVDQRMRFDPGDEVGRHGLGEPVAAHDHRHLRPGVGEVQRSLPCGVTRPYDRDALSGALGSFAATGPVVDAAVDQFVDAFHLEPSPSHPRRRDYDRGRDLHAAVEENHRRVGTWTAADGLAQEHELRPEPLGLAARSASELGTADPLRKTKKVLDHRGMRGLTAWKVAFEHDRRKPVRGGVHRRSEPRRSGADNRQVVVGALRCGGEVPG